MTVRKIFEEVRDCRSGVESVLFFVPSSDYRLCEILIVGKEICAVPAEICINFGQ